MTAGIKNTYAKDTYIGNTCAIGTWIRCTSIGGVDIGGICAKSALIRDIELRALVGLGCKRG